MYIQLRNNSCLPRFCVITLMFARLKAFVLHSLLSITHDTQGLNNYVTQICTQVENLRSAFIRSKILPLFNLQYIIFSYQRINSENQLSRISIIIQLIFNLLRVTIFNKIPVSSPKPPFPL